MKNKTKQKVRVMKDSKLKSLNLNLPYNGVLTLRFDFDVTKK